MQAQLSDIEALVERVREARLRDIVKQGIGYLHEGMHPGDQDIIHTLFQSGAIQVCALLPSCDIAIANSWSDIRLHTFPAFPCYIHGFLVGGKAATLLSLVLCAHYLIVAARATTAWLLCSSLLAAQPASVIGAVHAQVP